MSGPCPPACRRFLVASGAHGTLLPRPSDKPSIAVLPFDNLRDDPAQEYFGDGVTEDLITELSRLRHLLVIARALILTYLGRPDEAVDVLRRAMRLNPFQPGWYWHPLGRALHVAGRHEEGLTA